tara:strand:+ start:150 stop:701 length:552 start_codon:yes stop_codon:yes gene_type:complete
VVNIPSVPEIITVNSETLQTQIRDLLPSQNGFGSELQASNVIMPIIDLTAAAEGSSLDVSLAQAMSFGSITEFEVINTSTTLANTPGWYRILGGCTVEIPLGVTNGVEIQLNDGVSTKTVWGVNQFGASADNPVASQFDFIVGLSTGESLIVASTNVAAIITGSVRQVADSSGQTVNPNGLPL